MVQMARVFSIEKPPTEIAVNIVYVGSVGYFGFVNYNGKSYSAPFTVTYGDSIDIYVGASGSLGSNCTVSYKGTVVSSGQGLHAFTPKKNCTVTFTRHDSGSDYFITAEITDN